LALLAVVPMSKFVNITTTPADIGRFHYWFGPAEQCPPDMKQAAKPQPSNLEIYTQIKGVRDDILVLGIITIALVIINLVR
jgi:hypothetical protein